MRQWHEPLTALEPGGPGLEVAQHSEHAADDARYNALASIAQLLQRGRLRTRDALQVEPQQRRV